MNAVYIRVALYMLAAPLAAAGLGTFDPTTGTLTLDLNQLALVLSGSSALTAAVFAVWGKK